MQTAPEIWDDRTFFISKKQLTGSLACWAIRQSPYICPQNMHVALVEFLSVFQFPKDIDCDIWETSCVELYQGIMTAFDHCELIFRWNVPCSGHTHNTYVTRFDKPEPDNDFIDLHALARNIAHSITIEEKFQQEQDRKNMERYPDDC